MKPIVVTTWDRDPLEVPELAVLPVIWKSHPLTRTVTLNHPQLVLRLQEPSKGWLLVFSGAAVQSLVDHVRGDLSLLSGWKVAAVGSQTAGRLKASGIEVTLTGPGTGAELVRAVAETGAQQTAILLTGTVVAESTLTGAQASGMSFERFEIYQNVMPEEALKLDVSEFLKASAICLASPSAAERLWHLTQGAMMPPLLAIGPTTAQSIRDLGWPVNFIGESTGFAGFAPGIARFT